MAVPPDFVAGQILTAAQMNAVGLWKIKTQTVGTAVSSVAVTGAFSADYEHYRIIYVGGVASADITLLMTLGSTATGYYYAATGRRWDATDSPSQASNAASIPFAFASTASVGGTYDVFSPFAAKNTLFSGTTISASTAAATGLFRSYGGYLANTTSYTDFTLTTSSGTITGGTIYVYGYRD